VTALIARSTYTVDPWDPSYGVAGLGDEPDGRTASTARLDLDVEVPSTSWKPLWPSRDVLLPSAILFLDGVRRIDARVWVHGPSPQPVPGVAASLATGLVSCDGAARIVDVRVDRGLYTADPSAGELATRHGTYAPRRAGAGLDELSLAVQRRLAELEVETAQSWRSWTGADDDLLVTDGPLHGRGHLSRIVGYVKTHDKAYLDELQASVVSSLLPGQRTPVFAMTTSWRRNSWYLRLPTSASSPWSGVVRLECSADLNVDNTVELADLTAAVLPSFASVPHKDPRAPQNLVPIGGLERQLRHRLGDHTLLYRALRAATS